jgi:hypothetical protein
MCTIFATIGGLTTLAGGLWVLGFGYLVVAQAIQRKPPR